MNRFVFIAILCALPIVGHSQGFSKLGFHEKVWVFIHPFSAKKAQKITKHVISASDSLAKRYDWPSSSYSTKDAFRHGYWMSILSTEIGPKRAKSLGVAHEKKNQRDLLKNRLEEGSVPDNVSIEMDLYNNGVGIESSMNCADCNRILLLNQVLDDLRGGKYRVVLQTKEGEFLDAKKQILKPKDWQGNADSPRILVESTF